jgi:hypothetical protein
MSFFSGTYRGVILFLISIAWYSYFEAHQGDAYSMSQYVYSALENRLTDLKGLEPEKQPLFIQQNPGIRGFDLVQAVFANDDSEVLDALSCYFECDEQPLFTRQQLQDFLASDTLTASIWRNRSSESCIITVNTRRMDTLLLSIEHEITHVLQHAEIKCVGESVFIKYLYGYICDMYPDIAIELAEKYPNYAHSIEHLNDLPEAEKKEIVLALLEHHADIQACLMLKDHAETISFIQQRLIASRPALYASYSALNKLMN